MRASSATERPWAGRTAAWLLAAVALSACSTYGPGNLRAGQTEADVRARLGEPVEKTSLPGGGQRWDYPRGPYGPHTYRVELDAAGRVTGVSQLLTDANFLQVQRNEPSAAVRERLGRPSETTGGWRGLGEVWSYRYEHPMCRWFQVWVVDGRVREASYAPDPICDERRKLRGD